jgi:ABC-type lipoprotein export system ATPase subunit
MVSDSALFLADAPTGALDSRPRDEILSLFLSRRITLHDGRIIENDAVD